MNVFGLYRCFLLLTVLMVMSLLVDAKAPPQEEDMPTPPRVIRTCCAFGAKVGIHGVPFFKLTDVISHEDLGEHQYMGNRGEGNGILYTAAGGFIDLGHLRDHADWTAYIFNIIHSNAGSAEPITLELRNEGGAKSLTLPPSIYEGEVDYYELAGRIAYDISLWHEIATWFGASYVPFIAERYSSFSPEDIYSNLLGVKLGIEALKSDLDYDEAMTNLIKSTLDSLGVVSGHAETVDAMIEVDALWWSSERRIPSRKVLIEHHIDPGADQQLKPWLVPSLCEDVEPWPLDKPGAGCLNYYELSIKLNYKFPRKELCSDESGKVITQCDFDRILAYIEQEEAAMHSKLEARSSKREKGNKAG